MGNNIFLALKICLEIDGSNLTSYAASLIKPDGDQGVSRTTVSRVAKGEFPLLWLREAIVTTIQRIKSENPEEFERLAYTLHPDIQEEDVAEVV